MSRCQVFELGRGVAVVLDSLGDQRICLLFYARMFRAFGVALQLMFQHVDHWNCHHTAEPGYNTYFPIEAFPPGWAFRPSRGSARQLSEIAR